MPKPKHIPQKAWDKAQELLKNAPKMWNTSKICAGGYIDKNGEAVNSKYRSSWNGDVCHAFLYHPDENDYYDDDDDYDDEDDY